MVAINSLFAGLLATLLTTLVVATPVDYNVEDCAKRGKSSDEYVGYLGIVFKDDSEQINAVLSKGNSALDFEWLNGAQPILSSVVGTKHTRDPFLLRDEANKCYYIIATDNSLAAARGKGDWGLRYASRQITIYKSKGDSLLEWEDARLSHELMDWRSGGVSAPEAIWDESKRQWLVTFSSNLFEASDTKKTGTPGPSQIWSTYTTDFQTFTPARPYFLIKNGGSVDMTIAKIKQGNYVRFYRNDTNGDLKVQGQISNDGIFGLWSAISHDQQYIVSDQANGGPLVFKDNVDANLLHLWVDDFRLAYRAFESGNLKKGFTPSESPNFLKDMKQGSVYPLNQREYDLLKHSKWARQQQA